MGDPELDAWAKENEFRLMMQKYLYGAVIENPAYVGYVDTELERKDVMQKYAAASLFLVSKISSSLK